MGGGAWRLCSRRFYREAARGGCMLEGHAQEAMEATAQAEEDTEVSFGGRCEVMQVEQEEARWGRAVGG